MNDDCEEAKSFSKRTGSATLFARAPVRSDATSQFAARIDETMRFFAGWERHASKMPQAAMLECQVRARSANENRLIAAERLILNSFPVASGACVRAAQATSRQRRSEPEVLEWDYSRRREMRSSKKGL